MGSADVPVEEHRPLLELAVGEQVRLHPIRMPMRMSCTDPEVALCWAVLRMDPLLVQGLRPGTTDMLLQYGDGTYDLIDISVHRDLRALQGTVSTLAGMPPLPPPEGTVPLDVPLGSTLTIELPAPPQYAVVEDPDIVEVSPP